MIQAGKPVLILGEHVEGESLATIVVNKLRGTFQAVAVNSPGFGDRRKRRLEDIAILSGAEVITEALGLNIDGAGEPEAIKGRIKQLKSEIEDTDSDFDREKLQERLAKLAGGVSVVKVGAATEPEMKEKKHRVEDAPVQHSKTASCLGVPDDPVALDRLSRPAQGGGGRATRAVEGRLRCADPRRGLPLRHLPVHRHRRERRRHRP